MNTRRMRILGLIIGLATLLAAVAGCGSGGAAAGDDPTPAPGLNPVSRGGFEPVTVTSRYQDLEFTLTLPRTRFAPDEAVPMVFTATNRGTQEVTAQVSPQFVSVGAARGEMPVWSYVVAGIGGHNNIKILPGNSETVSLTWNQRENITNGLFGEQKDYAAPGTYALRALLAAYSINGVPVSPEDISLPPVEITIDASASALGDYRDLRMILSLPRTRFLIGEPVPVTLTVTNTGSAPIIASGVFPTPRLNISSSRSGSYATPYPGDDAPTVTETFLPGETRTYQGTWDQSINVAPSPHPAQPDRYTVRASLGYHLINGAGVDYDQLSAPTVDIELVSSPELLNVPAPTPPILPEPPVPPVM